MYNDEDVIFHLVSLAVVVVVVVFFLLVEFSRR